ncbi:hypothetical protein N0V88_006813 [Collariella sp. IMI 366227]|nr:hypothetical protein N0V88_006813 [Collariella sp. IMI 366227]
MPYTPPNRSPTATGPSSPNESRRPSLQDLQQDLQNGTPRPGLPRSASYLMRQRRTPSFGELSPEATSEDLRSMASGSVRQSPPPITGSRGMPNGAIMSPPESNSDDDEARRQQVPDPRALHQAVHKIKKDGSTNANGIHHSFSTGSFDSLSGRRFGHSRSATEPQVSFNKSSSSSATGSEEDSDEERQQKPQMVRKKSGELVRPALRYSNRRPSSMPGTPTFSKAVHFDSVEHVRHFLQVDRPLAVSAGSSPVEEYESDTEYPFSGDERRRTPSFEWELIMPNFPVETPVRRQLPVRLERVWLTPDQKSLIGSVAVANIAFHKLVACRFTVDYWKTTSEVAADYVCEVLPVDTPHRQDRFHFNIKLSDLTNLQNKTLYFCIRYTVNGQEYWDSNDGTNFQIDFRKKMLPQNNKRGIMGAASRPANGLPKSNRRGSRKPSPAVSEEFSGSNPNFNTPIHDVLGEEPSSGLRLKGVKSANDIPSDNLTKGLSGPTGQFAMRYDFADSLSKAIQNARSETKSDGLYMKSLKRTPSPSNENKSVPPALKPISTSFAPDALSPTGSPKADVDSAQYREMINKYCFYGSNKPKSTLPGTQSSASRPVDGYNSSTTASYEGSPVFSGNYQHSHSGTQHHSLHPHDANPYFTHHRYGPVGGSPAESPLAAPRQVPGQTPTTSAAPQTNNKTPVGTASRSADTRLTPGPRLGAESSSA